MKRRAILAAGAAAAVDVGPICGTTALPFAFCSAMWAACAVLVGQVSPEIIKMVHTFSWFIFDCTYMITTMQMVAMGLVETEHR
mgnify:CR=1 FL=1